MTEPHEPQTDDASSEGQQSSNDSFEDPSSKDPSSEDSHFRPPFGTEDFEGDLDTGDDEVIGRALRRSLQVIATFVAVVALGYGAWMLWPRADEAETVLATQGPERVEPEVTVEPPTVPFTDITRAAGIDYVHQSGAAGEKLLPETMGSGVAFADFDGDGDPDLLFVDGRVWPHDRAAGTPAAGSATFYRNRGDGSFEEATDAAGLRTDLYGTGVAIGDFDADGRLDLYLTAVGENRLYRNTGDGFVDVTARAGVAGGGDTWSTSAAFVDVDGDQDLDLFVANYVVWSRAIDIEVDYRLTGVGRAYGPPVNYAGTFSSLYLNQGDGTFVDVSEAAGIHVVQPATGVPVGKALGVAPADLDGDGAIDLVVANDTVQNFLFHNRGDGTFDEVGELWGLAYGRAGEATGAMGIDAAHFRNDDSLGFAIGNFANEMTSLYVAQGDASLFADEAISEGVGAPSRTLLTFGMLWLDVDLDGRLDLLETNGHLENEISVVDPSQSYEQAAQLFWNAGDAGRSTFVELSHEAIGDLATPVVGRGSAFADMDGDGDLDVVVTQVGRAPLLLRNDFVPAAQAELATPHRWLRLRLVDPGSPNRDAIGAWVTLRSTGIDGDRGVQEQRRQVMPARSYQSASELAVTFGLGAAPRLEALEIHWPDGERQALDVDTLALDRLHVVERGASMGDRDE
ncbi:MAG: CRTAC1 family protein [Acidobacteriota bacterium]